MRAFSFRGGRRKIAFEVGIPFLVHIVERSAVGGLYPLLLLDTQWYFLHSKCMVGCYN
jgi:hypothetical protein